MPVQRLNRKENNENKNQKRKVKKQKKKKEKTFGLCKYEYQKRDTEEQIKDFFLSCLFSWLFFSFSFFSEFLVIFYY